ncbi:aspartate racemase [Ralstonia sp. 1138]
MKMKTIGLIGGMSWESSAEYYRLINQGMKNRLGDHNNARSIMATVCFEEIKALQYAGRWDELALRMQEAALQVQAGGADLVLLCTNTMHKVAPAIEAVLQVPFVHIVDPTAQALKGARIGRVGLLGTRFTMEEDFYRSRMTQHHGIEVLIPEERARARVHDIIYDELCHGVLSDSSREEYKHIIGKLQARGARGIILGCTEITLLIGQSDVPIPVFDTTALHAHAAVSLALTEGDDA